ncbi:MAG: serine/threonine protein kinase, partial [Chloroflexi bacterium]|nr:serine/threonine protein kinase [Chloroflexota bacterium]
KPSNIMVDEQRNDHVTLMDFGLVRAAEGTGLTRTGTIVGTPEYMSPEQAEGEQVDNRTDIYSLGVVIFKMLTGHVPFSKSTPHAVLIAHITQEPPSITSINPSLPPAIEAVVRKAMAKDRETRYARVGELARDLTTAATGQVPAGLKAPRRAKAGAKAAVVARRPTAKERGKGWLWGLGAIAALLLLIACGAVAALALGMISLPTPTSPTMSAAPTLIGPPDDATFEGADDNVVLKWSVETPLEGEHAYYKVVLECPGGGQFAVRHVEWVRDTQLILPGMFCDDLAKASTNECEWSVMAVEVSADPPDEGNESPLGERSERRSFTWHAAAATTATPTRTPAATRTRQPTKSPTPTPAQTVTSTPSPAATSTRGPTTATPTTPTSPPTQPPATQPPPTQPPATQPPATQPPPTQPPATRPPPATQPPTQPPPTQPPPTQPPPTQPPPTQPPPTQPPPTEPPPPPP